MLDLSNVEISQMFLLRLVSKLKKDLAEDQVVIDMFSKKGVPLKYIEYVPIVFSDIDTSAKTSKGIIYLNPKMLKLDIDRVKAYIVHEITHWLDQCFSKEATESSDNDDYLMNEHEEKAFGNQVEYLKDNVGTEDAEEYVDNLLDYHEVDGKDRKKIEKKLLS